MGSKGKKVDMIFKLATDMVICLESIITVRIKVKSYSRDTNFHRLIMVFYKCIKIYLKRLFTTYNFAQILGLRMANSDGGMFPLEKFSDRRANDATTAEHNCVFARNRDSSPLNQFQTASWCTRYETAEVSNCHAAFVHSIQPVSLQTKLKLRSTKCPN